MCILDYLGLDISFENGQFLDIVVTPVCAGVCMTSAVVESVRRPGLPAKDRCEDLERETRPSKNFQ